MTLDAENLAIRDDMNWLPASWITDRSFLKAWRRGDASLRLRLHLASRPAGGECELHVEVGAGTGTFTSPIWPGSLRVIVDGRSKRRWFELLPSGSMAVRLISSRIADACVPDGEPCAPVTVAVVLTHTGRRLLGVSVGASPVVDVTLERLDVDYGA